MQLLARVLNLRYEMADTVWSSWDQTVSTTSVVTKVVWRYTLSLVQLFLVERYCVSVRPSVFACVRELDLSVSAAAERQGCCCEFLHKVSSFRPLVKVTKSQHVFSRSSGFYERFRRRRSSSGNLKNRRCTHRTRKTAAASSAYFQADHWRPAL